MRSFENDIKMAIGKLKQLHKKNTISAKKMALIDIDHLKINHKDLKKDDPLALYNKAQIILEAIKAHLNEIPVQEQEKGLEEYSFYLQGIVNKYHMYENHILHKDQYAASILIDAIQLCAMPNLAHTEELAVALRSKTEILCEIGNDHILYQLLMAFKQHTKDDEFFFIMQIHFLRKTLKQKGRKIKKPQKITTH